MPQFKAPFNYQAIFEIELDPATKQAYLNSVGQLTPGQVLSMVTEEEIVVADLAKNPKTFRASLYQGHYEKAESSPIEINTEIKIKDTVYFKELNANDPKPKDMEYLYLGSERKAGGGGAEYYLIHKITSPSDFDQILQSTNIHPFYEFPNKYYTFIFEGEKDPIDFNAINMGTKNYSAYEASDTTKKKFNVYAYREVVLETESLKK